MPWGDGSGPMGGGPMTGRGMGYCAGYGVPGHANRGYGYGAGRGGRGWRHRYYATGVPGWARAGVAPVAWPPAEPWSPPVEGPRPSEAAALKAQAEYLAEALEEARARLAELEAAKDE